jgi:hypothetical protein
VTEVCRRGAHGADLRPAVEVQALAAHRNELPVAADPRSSPSSMVLSRNGPGSVWLISSSISGTSAPFRGSASGSSVPFTSSPIICTTSNFPRVFRVAGTSTPVWTIAAYVPGGARAPASRQSSGDGSDGSAKNGATSVGYRSAWPQTCTNRACTPERAACTGLSRRASSVVDMRSSRAHAANAASNVAVS